jgi:hypothetical protein
MASVSIAFLTCLNIKRRFSHLFQAVMYPLLLLHLRLLLLFLVLLLMLPRSSPTANSCVTAFFPPASHLLPPGNMPLPIVTGYTTAV